jgi:hypothetical protein
MGKPHSPDIPRGAPNCPSVGQIYLTDNALERKAERDREIHAALEVGQSVEELGDVHGITCERIANIVTAERHRRTVSPEPF